MKRNDEWMDFVADIPRILFICTLMLCLFYPRGSLAGGTMTDLGTLPGGQYSRPVGINDSGQVVGYADTASGNDHAFLYSNGTMTDLGTLPGGQYSAATGINNAGQVVGYSGTASGNDHAFLYSNGTMTDLGTLTLPGYVVSTIEGINDSGQMAGNSFDSYGSSRAFLYSNGIMTDWEPCQEESTALGPQESIMRGKW